MSLEQLIADFKEDLTAKYTPFQVEGDHSEFSIGIFVPDIERLNESHDELAKQAYLQGIRDAKDVLPPHDPYTREEMMSREGQNRDLDFLMCKKTGYNTYREETLEAITRLEENI